MSDIETLRRVWREQEEADEPLLTRDALTEIVRDRTRAARDRVSGRLKKEIACYAAMTAGAMVVLMAKPPSAWLPAAACLLAVFGATGGVMLLKNRALQLVSIDGTLRDALVRMIGIVSSWMTLYLIAYMAIIAGAGAILLAVLARGRGIGPLWWLTAGCCALAVVWSYASGRAYIHREFEEHRDELRRVLADLEAV